MTGETTVRLWDTAPLKTRYQTRREAERLVEPLWREKKEPPRWWQHSAPTKYRARRSAGQSCPVLRRAQPAEAAPATRMIRPDAHQVRGDLRKAMGGHRHPRGAGNLLQSNIHEEASVKTQEQDEHGTTQTSIQHHPQ
jgi:hypothetical protein